MKNYALFAGDNQYPDGGFNDLKEFFDTKEEAAMFGDNRFDWYHVVDTRTFTVVIQAR